MPKSRQIHINNHSSAQLRAPSVVGKEDIFLSGQESCWRSDGRGHGGSLNHILHRLKRLWVAVFCAAKHGLQTRPSTATPPPEHSRPSPVPGKSTGRSAGRGAAARRTNRAFYPRVAGGPAQGAQTSPPAAPKTQHPAAGQASESSKLKIPDRDTGLENQAPRKCKTLPKRHASAAPKLPSPKRKTGRSIRGC